MAEPNRVTRCQAQLECVESADIGYRVIHQGLIRSGIPTSVGYREGITSCVGKAGADTAKSVARKTVFQRTGRLLREILIKAAHSANCNELGIGVGGASKQHQPSEQKIWSFSLYIDEAPCYV